MAVIFTKHAKGMLVFRRIKESLVNECVDNPDEILPTREGKKIYLKDLKQVTSFIPASETFSRII